MDDVDGKVKRVPDNTSLLRQMGAQQLDLDTRSRFGNDPLNLLTVDGPSAASEGVGVCAVCQSGFGLMSTQGCRRTWKRAGVVWPHSRYERGPLPDPRVLAVPGTPGSSALSLLLRLVRSSVAAPPVMKTSARLKVGNQPVDR